MRRTNGVWTFLAANATLVGYTASLMLASAAPVLAHDHFDDALVPAPAIEELALEPDTKFDAVRWHDRWWKESVQGITDIPAEFGRDMKGAYNAFKSILKDGIKVGNVLVVRGVPEAGRIFGDHGKKFGIHLLDTVRMFPDHVVKAGGHFKRRGQHIGKVASGNAAHTARVATTEFDKFLEDQKDTWKAMKGVGKWMGRHERRLGLEVWGDIKEDALWTRDLMSDAARWTNREVADSVSDTGRWMRDFYRWDRELVTDLAKWTKRQVPEGIDDTVRWTKNAARETGRMTSKAAEWTADNTVAAVDRAGDNIQTVARESRKLTLKTARAAQRAGVATDRFFEHAIKETAKQTLGRIPGEIKKDAKATSADFRYYVGEGGQGRRVIRDTVESAGDNYMAGDVEGIAIATFYSLAVPFQTIAYFLVLPALNFTGHTAWGVTKTVGLAAGGTAATAGLTGAAVATGLGVRAGGGALTIGVAALGGAATAGTALAEGIRIAGTAGAGGLMTAGAAVTGGLYTAGAAGAGVARTVGGATVGALGTTAAALGGVPVEAALFGAGAVRTAATGAAGIGLTAGALALGAVGTTADISWDVVKMVGVAAAGSAAEVLIPAFDIGVTTYRVAKVAGNAIVDNAIITPAVATWDILAAMTMGGWELVRDPVFAGYHLVAGVSGFSFRVVADVGAATTVLALRTLFSVAKAPLSLVYYGGEWTIAAMGKGWDFVAAPFKFETQNEWKRERLPQLAALLREQEPSVLDEIGNDVTYIRVIFSGRDRGKVNFFTTEKNGKRFEFKRQVKSNCLVVYESKNTPILLNSKLYDRHCLGRE